MNEKIADIIAIDGTPSALYASAYIKGLRAENERLKATNENLSIDLGQAKGYIDGLENELQDKHTAETQLRELLLALYKQTDNEKGFTIYRKDIVELANDYEIKEEELK